MIDQEQFLKEGLYNYPDKSFESFGWFQMAETTFRHILDILPEGKTILELGSGWVSTQLAKHYKVYTVEENKEYLNKHEDVNYIHIPVVATINYYNPIELEKKLPKDYDLLIVDGPAVSSRDGRKGFLKNLSLFKTNVPIFFDDTHMHAVHNTFVNVALKLNKVPHLFVGDVTKSYGVLL